MDRRKRTTEEETKKTKQNSYNGESEIFASCSFSSLGLHPTLCDQLRERMGFEVPTIVQAEAIPVILVGRHVLVNAATALGKLLHTWLLLLIIYTSMILELSGQPELLSQGHGIITLILIGGMIALVLVPTRELCMQVYEILQKLLHRFHWIVPGYVMGGEKQVKRESQAAQSFSSLLRKAVDGGFVSDCKASSRGGEGVNVSHLLFADDTLIFCGASKVQLLHLNWILMWFEAMSGLRINLDKSELIPVGCVNNVEELAAAIGCKVGSLPTSYLGLPLGAQYRSRAVWDGVEERMRKKLARWKSQNISKGGRITLIRSTLANMPIYFMSMLSMPRKVRLSWRFAMEREAFWNQVIRGKYGEEQGGWSSKEARGETHGVGLWKTLRKEWEVVKSRLVFVVGNGKRIKFWKDIWCGDEPLCVSFPSLFALAVSKDAWVKDVWRCNEGGGSWSPLFSRPFNDWELEEVCSFFVALNRKQIQQGVDDRVIWRETNCGKFSVKSLYKSLVSGHPISFPSSAIWKVTVQPRVSFFGWEATWGKALTLDQLQRRGWALANRCYLCQRHEESIDHILLHCEKVRTLWVLLYSMFGVQWVLPATVKETLSGWNGSFVGKKRKGVWKASPLCLFWTVWKTRNKVAFEEEELSIQRLKASFVYFLWSETKRSIKDGPSTLVDFVGWVASR
ncbi:DEAD-box ATP-dependent RNA helicase 17 [Vitis vinifera]|uniref:DEAD-box ATP-dependent RNA helicase 17 n=1 Tax=Vitis vinifera TaxID=29760 RepID=A0A438E8L9_VITVI|nr:DEAD-box ATP-dependent RNA helicase 17 [Vitis vinifera]